MQKFGQGTDLIASKLNKENDIKTLVFSKVTLGIIISFKKFHNLQQ